jgi:hypothetical protein
MSAAKSGADGTYRPFGRYREHTGPGAESRLRLLLSRNGSWCVVVGGITAPSWFGRGRRRCRCRLCHGFRLWRRCHVVGVIEAQRGHAGPGPFLALRHGREKAFDVAAIASVDFHANGIIRIVPLSRCRRCGEDHSDPKDQPNQPAHDIPRQLVRSSNTASGVRTSYKTITIVGYPADSRR